MPIPLQERVRQRLRDLVERNNVSREILAKRLGLSVSGVSRILTEDGYTILWQHLEGFCEFFQVTPCELVIDPGAIIQAVNPLEAAILEHIRKMTELERRSLLTLLERPIQISHRKAKPGRAMLSDREQELVDLFGRVKADGVREGVLKMLRGAADGAVRSHKTE